MSEPEDCSLQELVNAIQEQTRAITSLVNTNMMLIQALAESEGIEDEDQAGTYLDGSPVT